MHEQRSAAPQPLSLVMPSHSLRCRRTSMQSSASGPHTPPPRNSPLPITSSASNRKSSDSWNSSNYDAGEDDWEWTSEQTRLLSRTLEALPSHLLTPFNGPVPPSNLLDKIAKSVICAKGPIEWPHSLRATRAKIIELARLRASEDTSSDTIAEEEPSDILQQTTNTGPKRPLYRQSSMDFMQSSKLEHADSGTIARLSNRLHNTERMIPNPARPPYVRSSPRVRSAGRPIPSSPSSTTLNSESSCNSASRIPRLQRSMSDISNSSDSYVQPAVDPRLQRIRRAESFTGSALYGSGSPLKRAPSYSSISKRHSDSMSVDCSNRSDVTSSDEEEKLRTKRAKKPRVKAGSPTPPPVTSPIASPEKAKPLRRSTRSIVHAPSPTSSSAFKDTPRRSSRPKANLQRNPSILGPELPPIATQPQASRLVPLSPSPVRPRSARRPSAALTNASGPLRETSMVLQTPTSSSRKPSRRSKAASLASGALARKISFGAIGSPAGEENVGSGVGCGLGSAFQLQ
ncbi:hypothetical protein BV20DRAFT_949599 [Pilatotrama ljubarskyi]|nr:hypothetical protein BV20DRAFT_949599 [Pilatotrama ljubarskyi]